MRDLLSQRIQEVRDQLVTRLDGIDGRLKDLLGKMNHGYSDLAQKIEEIRDEIQTYTEGAEEIEEM